MTTQDLRPRLDNRRRLPLTFRIAPEGERRAALADLLGVSQIKKLVFEGELTPSGRADWRLGAKLGATVVQPCDITTDPVTTRIDEVVTRIYSATLAEETAADMPLEQEVPEDDETEALPAVLDIESVMMEALSLSLPAFPRAEGAHLGRIAAEDPSAGPDDETQAPFANLRALLGNDD